MKNDEKSFLRSYFILFYNLIIGRGGIESWMSQLEIPRGANYLNYKIFGNFLRCYVTT